MIHADQRCSFRKPVSLDHSKPEPPPELLGFAIERCSAGNESPKLPSKFAMNMPEHPPAADEMSLFRCSIGFAKMIELSLIFQITLNLLFQRLHHPRYSHEYRNTLSTNAIHHL